MEGEAGRGEYRVWIDPNGEVWIEDPDHGALPLLESLQPGFRFGGSAWMPPPANLGRTRRIAAPLPWPDDLEALWELHDRLCDATPQATLEGPSLLDLKRAIAQRLVRACVLCEHRCGVDRPAGERGRCKVGAQSYFGEAYVHQGEEREIAPSLCVALTGCSWHCVYCHTHDLINRVDRGTPLAPDAYAELYARAMAPEVRTLSFVGGNPDHHLVAILDFLAAAPADFDRPIVWNSNMYGSPELYRLLEGVVDVYLGDFRYGNDACAAHLSGLTHAWEPVTRNWRLVREQAALLIVRLLVLPGHLECCLVPMLAWLDAELGHARVSLLDQFHPAYLVSRRAPELNRRPTDEELARARALLDATALGEVER